MKECCWSIYSYDDKLFNTSDIILGTQETNFKSRHLETIPTSLHEEGLTTQVDTPFSGGNIIATLENKKELKPFNRSTIFRFI